MDDTLRFAERIIALERRVAELEAAALDAAKRIAEAGTVRVLDVPSQRKVFVKADGSIEIYGSSAEVRGDSRG